MRICPSCLSVYPDKYNYCSNDGKQTFDTESIEAEQFVKQLILEFGGKLE